VSGFYTPCLSFTSRQRPRAPPRNLKSKNAILLLYSLLGRPRPPTFPACHCTSPNPDLGSLQRWILSRTPEPQVKEGWHTLRHQSPATSCEVSAAQLYLPTTTKNCLQALRTLSVACVVNREGVGVRVFPRNCPKVLQSWVLRGSERATRQDRRSATGRGFCVRASQRAALARKEAQLLNLTAA
jgi:hypothetical protein